MSGDGGGLITWSHQPVHFSSRPAHGRTTASVVGVRGKALSERSLCPSMLTPGIRTVACRANRPPAVRIRNFPPPPTRCGMKSLSGVRSRRRTELLPDSRKFTRSGRGIHSATQARIPTHLYTSGLLCTRPLPVRRRRTLSRPAAAALGEAPPFIRTTVRGIVAPRGQ